MHRRCQNVRIMFEVEKKRNAKNSKHEFAYLSSCLSLTHKAELQSKS